MKPPTIGYVTKMFPRLSETFILNEILELERQGLSLHIFSLKRPTDSVSHEEYGLVRAPITYLPERICREPLRVLKAQFGVFRRYPRSYRHTLRHVVRRGRRRRSVGKSLRKFCQACCLIHEMNAVHYLHAHFANNPTKLAFLVHRITGIPYSVSTHAKDLYREERLTSAGLQHQMSRAHFVIANSQCSAAALKAAFNGEAPPRIYTIYNGINLAAFRPRQEEPDESLILSVGRLVEKKGFPVLIEACALLKEQGVRFQCAIVGAGPQERVLQGLIKHSGLEERVRLAGPMSQHELRRYYLRATVFVLPCILATDGDRDVLPNVLKEAMAVGVPVVTTRIPAIEELVEHRTSGLLIPPGDVQALAQAVEELLTNSALRHRLATQARTVIEERFDGRANVAQLKSLLLGAVPGKQNGIPLA